MNKNGFFPELLSTIEQLKNATIHSERKIQLNKISEHINQGLQHNQTLRLNFICTHNSRRSHLCQIWMQTLAQYFDKKIECYSGGTEETAVYPSVINALEKSGFQIQQISENEQIIYGIKFGTNHPSIIAFSKKYDNPFNPVSQFTAIMNCTNAETNCPIVMGADSKLSLKFTDPKMHDKTEIELKKYREKSTEIASEIYYILSMLK